MPVGSSQERILPASGWWNILRRGAGSRLISGGPAIACWIEGLVEKVRVWYLQLKTAIHGPATRAHPSQVSPTLRLTWRKGRRWLKTHRTPTPREQLNVTGKATGLAR